MAVGSSPEPEFILAFESFGVGDVVCALPAVRELKNAYPEAELIFVTSRTALQFCENLPFIDRCEICPGSWRDAWRFLRRWRPRRKNALAVLLNDGWWQNLCAHLLGARWACGYLYRRHLDTRYHPERLVTATWLEHYEKVIAPETHLVNRSMQAVRPVLGEEVIAPAPVPELSTLTQGSLPDYVSRIIEDASPFVVVHPGTAGKIKRWPEESWRELIADLSNTNHLIVTGSPAEADFCRRLSTHGKEGRVHCLAGELNLAQEATLMSQADYFVGPDCGPAHLASAAGCPVVMIMGPTVAETSGPFWNTNRILTAMPSRKSLAR
jgi:heptosyltransferase-1/heptosyltransferase-2